VIILPVVYMLTFIAYKFQYFTFTKRILKDLRAVNAYSFEGAKEYRLNEMR
jgi:hypothetical protein